MTWGGWNAEAVAAGRYAPSLLGLTRSLPLFLSQYQRTDFPFDAVQLFGLHNDEIPMRHWGDADVLDLWNREFAFPKMVAAPQRDFFRYITTRFGDRIQTFKGDGGAYWEDEAGADARVAALIRAAQAQIVTARRSKPSHCGCSPTSGSIRSRSTQRGATSCWPTRTSGATRTRSAVPTAIARAKAKPPTEPGQKRRSSRRRIFAWWRWTRSPSSCVPIGSERSSSMLRAVRGRDSSTTSSRVTRPSRIP